jgi:hypothetical protein
MYYWIFLIFARRDEFLSGEFGGHMIEGSDADAVDGQDGSDRQSPMRGNDAFWELVLPFIAWQSAAR